MSCIVLDNRLANINVIRELGVSIEGTVQGYSFCPPKNTNRQIKQCGEQKTFWELCGTKDV